jgi:pectin methylesterase-like acyl-CoA thioesterase
MVKRLTTSAAIIAVALAVAMLVAAPASATALVVRPGASIQAAVDAARSGDTVVVLPGTYQEAVCITTDGTDQRGTGSVIVPQPRRDRPHAPPALRGRSPGSPCQAR